MEMRPFVGVICWQRCSASYLCLELWPRCAVCNCAPASILTEFLGLKLHFFTYKSTVFFPLYCYDEGNFGLLTVRNEEGRTVQLVLRHAFSPGSFSPHSLLHLAGSSGTCWNKIPLAQKYVISFLWPKDTVLSMSLEDLAACQTLNLTINLILVFCGIYHYSVYVLSRQVDWHNMMVSLAFFLSGRTVFPEEIVYSPCSNSVLHLGFWEPEHDLQISKCLFSKCCWLKYLSHQEMGFYIERI